VETPIVLVAADFAGRHGWGILNRLHLSGWVAAIVAIVLMDYTLYLWHILTHRVPVLWRFHAVHHIDRDLDASTAVRFHFGELALSTPWRVAQVLLIGISPVALSIWQALLLMSTLFHHSNVDLPPRLERYLSTLIVTPRMHGIHHSVVAEDANSNWSSGLSLWDWLHKTIRLDGARATTGIGVPAFSEATDVALSRMLTLPFERDPPIGLRQE
jgi:sterol desaturase/sphingolipid hydroxylase (fatty acid hydroxylase superfamily)